MATKTEKNLYLCGMKFRLLIAAIVIATLASYSANVKFYSVNNMHGISMNINNF
ncbi:MAG: hypothetical protein LBU22_03585 [Dysgonamonadaceae bacterium]|jgi:hypothetical protein|nr:hypothetical protein [Dysgonamonadaceae bacterium]